jgi:hypothetical protein
MVQIIMPTSIAWTFLVLGLVGEFAPAAGIVNFFNAGVSLLTILSIANCRPWRLAYTAKIPKTNTNTNTNSNNTNTNTNTYQDDKK